MGEVHERRDNPFTRNGWVQLGVGIVGMVAITNLQYGWTLFVEPLHEAFGWEKGAIQVAFTLFVLAETWLGPVEGYLVDRYGPRRLVAFGGLLVALAWVVNARAESLTVLYGAEVVSGVGAGIVYATTVGNALKLFPHRRGLAAGLTAAAFGAGSALTILPLQGLIEAGGYRAAFFWFGLGQGAVVLLCAVLLRAPTPADLARLPPAGARQSRRSFPPAETVRAPVFWLMYTMVTMTTAGGLMLGAQLAPMARDYGVADLRLNLLGASGTALSFALVIDRVCNGLSRPFFGWVSDHLGRENTLCVAFVLEGAAIALLIAFAGAPVLFVAFTALTFFAWGEIYSLFPALCGDLFGGRYATTNYGFLYTAKGTAALLVPIGNLLQETSASWAPIFGLAIGLDWAAALLAVFALKPLRRRWLAREAPRPEGSTG